MHCRAVNESSPSLGERKSIRKGAPGGISWVIESAFPMDLDVTFTSARVCKNSSENSACPCRHLAQNTSTRAEDGAGELAVCAAMEVARVMATTGHQRTETCRCDVPPDSRSRIRVPYRSILNACT